MLRFKPSRMTVVVGLAAAVIIAAGGGAIASNMGFKINMPLSTTAGGVGDNWLSVPYNNPYGNAGAFCSQTGLPSVIPNQASITVINPCTNVASSCSCGTAACNSLPIVNSSGVCAGSQPGCLAFRVKGATVPSSIIIVGSHNPTLTCNIPTFTAGVSGDYWFGVPYHTTAVTFADICVQGGFPSTFPNQAQMTIINPATNVASNANCGTAAAGTTNLVLGRGVRVHLPVATGARSFIPAHF